MMPGSLTKDRERQRVALNRSLVSIFCGGDFGKQFRTEQIAARRHRLERPHPTQHLSTIVSGHANGSNLSRALVYKKIRRMVDGHAAVGESNGPFRIVREI